MNFFNHQGAFSLKYPVNEVQTQILRAEIGLGWSVGWLEKMKHASRLAEKQQFKEVDVIAVLLSRYAALK